MKNHFAPALFAALALACFTQVDAASVPRARNSALADATPPLPSVAGDLMPYAVDVASFSESFDDITQLAGRGWVLQNNSAPVGSTNWFQGTSVGGGGPFDAYNGAANAYIGANYNNTGSTGTISNWMLTPEIDFGGGAQLTFYTRKVSPDTYADRLEVRVSTNGASTSIGAPGNGVGDFTTLALSINPTLALGVYPTAWTQYTITGLPHNGQGRIAFRYYVTGGGFSGTSSDYIGIDQVDYDRGTPEYSVSGSVSGLAGSGLTLLLNGTTSLGIASNGSFALPGYVADGAAYEVTVATQPGTPNQTCSVANGSGTIAGADAADVAVTCTTDTYAVGGSVTGLAGSGLVLHLDNGDDLAIGADGQFVFPTAVTDGVAFTVEIGAQPAMPNQACSVANGSGTIAGGAVTDVAVSCVTLTYHVGGTVSGLAGSGLILHLDNGDDLPIAADGTFQFAQAIVDGSPYAASVAAQPAGPNQTCSIGNGSGTLAGFDVTDLSVTCTTTPYHVGGSVTGLAGSGLVLHLDNGADLSIGADGAFVFPAGIADGSSYVVSIETQPAGPNQTCAVSNGSGTVHGGDVANVGVQCTTETYLIGGAVSGLAGGGLSLHLSNGEDLPVAANGSFLFDGAITDGSSYQVTVATQPKGPQQNCVVTNGSGTLAGHDVTTVAVSCTTLTYSIGGDIEGTQGLDLILQLNGANDLVIGGDGPFTFAANVGDGSPYAVTVLTPEGRCVVRNGSGIVAGHAVVGVQIACDILFASGFEQP